jgi:DNA-binding NtrC family response regulator
VDLLRVLQTREFHRLGGQESVRVDVRILAATNRDLRAAIQEGRFREDLYYRLNVITIPVPPLRDRREDIPLLAEAFIRKHSLAMNREPVKVAPSALRLLTGYDWPGNVRELENVIERALVIGKGREIAPEDLPFPRQHAAPADYPRSLKLLEKMHIEKILEEVGWNIRQAARVLEIDRQTLYNKMKKYGIVQRG